MAFNSFEFLVFFPIVVLVFFIIPRKARRLWLLAASYYFYMRWNAVYAALIAASTLVTYLAGIFISKVSEDDSEEKIEVKEIEQAPIIISNEAQSVKIIGLAQIFKFMNEEHFSSLKIFLTESSPFSK